MVKTAGSFGDFLRFSSIARSISMLVGGSGASQAINLLGTILVARLYGPHEYGLFAVFISAQAILLVFASMRLDLALVVEEYEDNILDIVFSITLISILVSLISFILVATSHFLPTGFTGLIVESPAMWFLPITLLVGVQYQIATQWCVRLGAFKQIAIATMSVSAAIVTSQLLAGMLNWGAAGLALGYLVGQAAGTAILWRSLLAQLRMAERRARFAEATAIRATIVRHYRFVAYQAPNSLASAAYINLPNIILGALISPGAAGAFSLAFRVLFQPLALLPAALGQVVFSKMARTLDHLAEWERPLASAYLVLGLILAGPCGIMVYFGREIATTVLGPNWVEAGAMAEKLAIPCLMMALAAGYDRVFDTVGAQKLAFILSASSSICVLSLVYAMAYYTNSAENAVISFCIFHLIYSMSWMVSAIYSCGFSVAKAILRWVFVFVFCCLWAISARYVESYFSNFWTFFILIAISYIVLILSPLFILKYKRWV